jgi:DNA invertase Pin-like site-specific DNA recombinase
MICRYARASTGGQSEAAQVRQLRAARAKNAFQEVASGAKTDRPQLRRLLAEIGPGDVMMVTRLDPRPSQYPRGDRASKEAWFRSLADARADATTAHGRLLLTVLGGLAEFERELIRACTGEGRQRAKAHGQSLGRPFKLTAH